MTEDDKRMRSQELVALLEREDGLKAQAKVASQGFKARTEEAEAARKDIQRALRDSKELRSVDVEERHNYVRRVVETVRMDTFEVIESRAMRPNELQEALPIEAFQPFSKEDAKRARSSVLDAEAAIDGAISILDARAKKRKKETGKGDVSAPISESLVAFSAEWIGKDAHGGVHDVTNEQVAKWKRGESVTVNGIDIPVMKLRKPAAETNDVPVFLDDGQ